MKIRSAQELKNVLQRAYRNPLPRSRDQSNRIREILRDSQEVWPVRFKHLIEGTLSSKAKRQEGFPTPEILQGLLERWSRVFGLMTKCPSCGGPIYPKSLYRPSAKEYCSSVCSNSNPDKKNKAVETELERYRGSHNAHPEVQKKKQVTWMRTLGVLNPSKSQKVLRKIKRTWKAKYGHNIPFKDHLVAAKREETWLENYGTSHPWSNDEVSRSRQDTLERRYGARNPQQVTSVKRRTARTNMARYGGLQGFEPQAIKYLVRIEKVDPNLIAAGSKGAGCFKYEFKGQSRAYYPDIFIPGKIGTYVEVKSDYTLKQDPECIKAKLRAVRDSGFRVRLMVMNKEGVLVKNYQWEPLKPQPF